MITSDAIRKIRKIQIITSRMATDLFVGNYRSAFKGRGMEFGELREYDVGDDIRFIDWNVTARRGRPYVKKFREERESTVLFMIDISSSCRFGTVNYLKTQLAAEICSLLAFAALKNNDKIGLILFTDRIEKFIPPRKGSRQALRIIRDALYFKPEGKGTDISLALDYVSRILKRRIIIFMMSDLFASGFEKSLSVIARRHDIIVMTMNDPVEVDLPDAGILKLQDAETGKEYFVDSANSRLRNDYRTHNLKRLDDRGRRLRSLQVDSVDIFSNVPYLRPLIQFFRMRERKVHS
jgi:uncharacterized protein (DUF58 family)